MGGPVLTQPQLNRADLTEFDPLPGGMRPQVERTARDLAAVQA